MAPGFTQFAEIFEPYEDFVCEQCKAVDYLRALSSNAEFMTYLKWCHNKNPTNRQVDILFIDRVGISRQI